MKKKLIEQFINNMTTNDIISFASKNNVTLSYEEVNYVYKEIKDNWEVLIFGDPTNIFSNLKKNISEDNYEKAIELFNLYRNKYKNYL